MADNITDDSSPQDTSLQLQNEFLESEADDSAMLRAIVDRGLQTVFNKRAKMIDANTNERQAKRIKNMVDDLIAFLGNEVNILSPDMNRRNRPNAEQDSRHLFMTDESADDYFANAEQRFMDAINNFLDIAKEISELEKEMNQLEEGAARKDTLNKCMDGLGDKLDPAMEECEKAIKCLVALRRK
eukprot:GEMP01102857.1.p1 GENE.GEMP01102857.1~~GEMP01102857.1.p1  ORF type:complete len:185 (-),score=28.99 GEMP01102857.1:116-670(-)